MGKKKVETIFEASALDIFFKRDALAEAGIADHMGTSFMTADTRQTACVVEVRSDSEVILSVIDHINERWPRMVIEKSGKDWFFYQDLDACLSWVDGATDENIHWTIHLIEGEQTTFVHEPEPSETNEIVQELKTLLEQ